jgi:ABC-type branched-subunit amino acid transport system substrate-binding protein
MLIFAATAIFTGPILGTSVAMGEPLKIAVALSITGRSLAYGAPEQDGIGLAIEEANALPGAPTVEATYYDDESNPDRARELAQKIIASDALLAIGPATSPTALAACPDYAKGNIVSLTTTATADGITDNATTFRASYGAGDVGAFLANYLYHILKQTHAVVLFKDDGYGQSVVRGFRRIAERLQIETTYRGFTTSEERDEAARLAGSYFGQPIILAMLDVDAASVLKTLRRQGSNGLIIGANSIGGEYFNANFDDEPEERG